MSHNDMRHGKKCVNIQIKKIITLKLYKWSTTHGSNASLSTVTVTFGIGWANLGRDDDSEI